MTLFWKIFLSFWLTVVLMVLCAVWMVSILHHEQDIPLRGALARHFDQLQQHLQHEGRSVLTEHPHHPADEPDELVVADIDNHILWPRQASDSAKEELSLLTPATPASRHVDEHMLQVGILLHTDNGEILKVVARQPLPPPRRHAVFIASALLVSILVCSLLTRALVKPLRQVSKVAGQLAEGKLDARINMPAPLLGQDELYRLADDFDHMAGKLEQSIDAHRQLLHDVSHELRSPLTRILLAVELARGKNHPVDPTVDQSLSRIDLECGQLNQLIGELLSLPRLDAQTVQLEEQIDLAALLEDRLQAARIEADLKQLQLDIHTSSDGEGGDNPVLVKGQADLLARAIDNLLGNAIRYSPASSAIAVTLDTKASNIVLSVQDQGVGVPDADLERIFEPFVRVESARERRGNGGFGLGLALVKKIVLVHGGHVVASNTRPGFRIDVYLPQSVEKIS
jgi:signal transduction histidine kinase